MPEKLSDLQQHNYIQHSGRQQQTPIVSLKKPPSHLLLGNKLKANNIQFIKNCVLKGLGIAQFHDYVVANELIDGSLVEVLAIELKKQEELYIYYKKNRFVQPKVRSLVNLFFP